LSTSRSTEAELSKTTSVYTLKSNKGETFHHEGNELIRSEKIKQERPRNAKTQNKVNVNKNLSLIIDKIEN
jgi:hypothetical protein